MSDKKRVYELDFGDTNLLSEKEHVILDWIKTDMENLKVDDDLNYKITVKMMTDKEISALPEWS